MSCMPSSLYKPLTVYCIIVEPPDKLVPEVSSAVRRCPLLRGFTIIRLCTPNMFKGDIFFQAILANEGKIAKINVYSYSRIIGNLISQL